MSSEIGARCATNPGHRTCLNDEARQGELRVGDVAQGYDEKWVGPLSKARQPPPVPPPRPVDTADLLAGLDADQQEHAPQRAVLDAEAGR